MLKREDIRIRDPFIFTDKENGCYYMYGTTATDSFSVFKSYDLESFEEPKVIFDGKKGNFWADRNFWAPELHRFNGKYYLFATCKSATRNSGTQVFVCDTPDGEFAPVSEFPATPEEWDCLDGTLWVEDGTPYMVFCHSWEQIHDGEICAIPLSQDLSHPIGEPFLLFHASDNKYVTAYPSENNYVTDGPFLFKEDGKLKMIWSSFANRRYIVICAESDSLKGEWKHYGSLFDFDGGHAMLFERLDGTRMISLHSPNKSCERAHFYEF
jgi:GH43 family beta-xylosidase